MSKIGILVVYVFDETLQPLFDIHLDRIRRHTTCKYQIYAAGHKLAKRQLEHVSRNSDVKLFRFDVPKEYGARDEHSFCLRRLADEAFSDGCKYVICMHLDSFPIIDNWQSSFTGPIKCGKASVVSIVPNGYSAGLCWGKGLETHFAPDMLVNDEDRAGELFQRFVTEFPDFDHVETGLGVIFTAYKNVLGWERIGTNRERKIYGGLLFHVVGATWRTWLESAPIKKTALSRLSWPAVRRLIRLFPTKFGRRIRKFYIDYDHTTRDGSLNSKMLENIALIANPNGYVEMELLHYRNSEKVYR